uniref:Uncharacterized protein n=1 Tax=Physcomitrium patens TaxID=3218 RepID=A0A7I4EWP1_PHYPA
MFRFTDCRRKHTSAASHALSTISVVRNKLGQVHDLTLGSRICDTHSLVFLRTRYQLVKLGGRKLASLRRQHSASPAPRVKTIIQPVDGADDHPTSRRCRMGSWAVARAVPVIGVGAAVCGPTNQQTSKGSLSLSV